MVQTLIIIGNGMASTKLLERLRALAPDAFNIHVFGAEPRHAYNRVLLSPLLAGELTPADLELKPQSWWSDNKINLHIGCRVTAIDPDAKTITTDAGQLHTYDILVLATGSEAIRLPKPGMDLPGVLTFRDVDDAAAMLDMAKTKSGAESEAKSGAKSKFVVIGGGLLGLEAAYGLKRAGAEVTLVHLMDRLMERQLDAPAAVLLKTAMENRGITILLAADTSHVVGSQHVTGLALSDGRVLDADGVICAVGVRPQITLAKAAGLTCQRGICVDDHLRTSDAAIYAIGECAEHRNMAYGLVEPTYAQAHILAQHLTKASLATYAGSVLSTNLKVSGVGLFSAGDFIEQPGDETLVYSDQQVGTYKKLIVRGDTLAGAILVGETTDALWYLDLIQQARPLQHMRADLMFGRTLAMPEAA